MYIHVHVCTLSRPCASPAPALPSPPPSHLQSQAGVLGHLQLILHLFQQLLLLLQGCLEGLLGFRQRVDVLPSIILALHERVSLSLPDTHREGGRG